MAGVDGTEDATRAGPRGRGGLELEMSESDEGGELFVHHLT
jgi:hypothetical protein